jgi:hypothetical protein
MVKEDSVRCDYFVHTYPQPYHLDNPKLYFSFLHRYKTPCIKIIYKFQYFHENNSIITKTKWCEEITID